MRQSRKSEYWNALFDLVACISGFGAATFIEGALNNPLEFLPLIPEVWVPSWALSTAVAWFFIIFAEQQWPEGVQLWFNGFLAIIGGNLLIQYGLSYLFGFQPASLFVFFVGSACSVTLAYLLRKIPLKPKDIRKGIVLVGCDIPVALSDALRSRIIGGVDNSPTAILPGLQCLGGLDDLDEICATQSPATIVVSGHPTGLSFRQLLQLHYSGIEVEDVPFVYETDLHCVAWQFLDPFSLLFFLNPDTSRVMLAFQAIYKNVVGLALRLIFAPLLILTSLLIVVFTRGPALEHIECLGFRRVPFQMLRFRTLGLDGSPSRIGNLITRLNLVNLPQLMNVVRGEMALFGPAPVRTVFADRLSQLVPAYVYRFTVKPGILGWPQANLTETDGLPDEMVRLEFDLYYIKQESPTLDLDIMLRMLFKPSSAKRKTAAGPVIAKNA